MQGDLTPSPPPTHSPGSALEGSLPIHLLIYPLRCGSSTVCGNKIRNTDEQSRISQFILLFTPLFSSALLGGW